MIAILGATAVGCAANTFGENPDKGSQGSALTGTATTESVETGTPATSTSDQTGLTACHAALEEARQQYEACKQIAAGHRVQDYCATKYLVAVCTISAECNLANATCDSVDYQCLGRRADAEWTCMGPYFACTDACFEAHGAGNDAYTACVRGCLDTEIACDDALEPIYCPAIAGPSAE
jgi:hypothetical protein